MILALVLIPAVAGAAAFVVRRSRPRRGLLIVAAIAHALVTAAAWIHRPAATLSQWLVLDALGLLFLSITSLLFLAAAVYAVGYLAREACGNRPDFEEGGLFSNAPEAVYPTA